MQMNLDVAVTGAAQGGNLIKVLGVVLVPRVKECMLRRTPIRIAKSRDRTRIVPDPSRDAGILDITSRPLPQGLIVIAHRYKYVSRPLSPYALWREQTSQRRNSDAADSHNGSRKPQREDIR